MFPSISRLSMIEDDLNRQKNKEAEKQREKEKRYVLILHIANNFVIDNIDKTSIMNRL